MTTKKMMKELTNNGYVYERNLSDAEIRQEYQAMLDEMALANQMAFIPAAAMVPIEEPVSQPEEVVATEITGVTDNHEELKEEEAMNKTNSNPTTETINNNTTQEETTMTTENITTTKQRCEELIGYKADTEEFYAAVLALLQPKTEEPKASAPAHDNAPKEIAKETPVVTNKPEENTAPNPDWESSAYRGAVFNRAVLIARNSKANCSTISEHMLRNTITQVLFNKGIYKEGDDGKFIVDYVIPAEVKDGKIVKDSVIVYVKEEFTAEEQARVDAFFKLFTAKYMTKYGHAYVFKNNAIYRFTSTKYNCHIDYQLHIAKKEIIRTDKPNDKPQFINQSTLDKLFETCVLQ